MAALPAEGERGVPVGRGGRTGQQGFEARQHTFGASEQVGEFLGHRGFRSRPGRARSRTAGAGRALRPAAARARCRARERSATPSVSGSLWGPGILAAKTAEFNRCPARCSTAPATLSSLPLSALLLAACAALPGTPEPSGERACAPCPSCPPCPGAAQAPVPGAPAAPATPAAAAAQASDWSAIEGWQRDELSAAWPALRASCTTLVRQAPWKAVCEAAAGAGWRARRQPRCAASSRAASRPGSW